MLFRSVDIWAAQSEDPEDARRDHREARFIMRLFKNDTLQLFDLDEDGQPIAGSNGIKRAVRLEPSANRVRLVGLNEAGVFDNRHGNTKDPFRWDFANIGKLKMRRVRRVRVDELGRVRIVPHGVI